MNPTERRIVVPCRPISDAPSPWRYRWEVILTRRPHPYATATEDEQLTVDSVDELTDIVRHTSLDPRVVAYQYHRRTELDLTAAPNTCDSLQCGELFSVTPPRQRWQHCICGGHLIFICVACGTEQPYPKVSGATCTN